MRQTKYEYDAFISHAVEDKIPIANELCAKLESAGLRIWYSGKELGVGDSIEKTIEKGLHRSRYGIVILSPTYLAKNWTIREFYTLLAKEIEEQKVILPVLYNVTVDELKNKDLLMADRFAVSADRGLDFVVSKLVAEIRRSKVKQPKMAWFSKMWTVLILSLLANVAFLLKGTGFTVREHARAPQSSLFSAGGPSGASALFSEMERLAGSLGNCSCTVDHGERSMTRQVHFADNGQKQNTNAYDDAAGSRPTHVYPGKKLTMAVVLKIETPGHSEPGDEREVNELLDHTDEPSTDPTWISLEAGSNEDEPMTLCSSLGNSLGD